MAIRNVLVSTDFSDASRLAVKRALEIAAAFGAKLHVVHVVEQVPMFLATRLEETESGKVAFEERIVTEAKRNSRASLREIPNPAGVAVEEHFRSGFTPNEILDAIGTIDPDLLVMATHGRHGFSRAFLGSVTEKVIRAAGCPVLTCKLQEGDNSKKEFRPERVLYPVNLSDEKLHGLDLAAEIALHYGSELHFVHVLRELHSGFEWDEVPLASARDFVDEWRVWSRETLDDLLLKNVPAGIETHAHLKRGRPHVGVLQCCEEIGCDLVVMPTHGRSGLSHALLGSVTERVVRLSSCPVLTVRGPA